MRTTATAFATARISCSRPKGSAYSKRDLCAKRVPPQEAINAGWVKMPASGRVSDSLRCKHIVDARDQLATSVIRSLSYAEQKKAAEAQH
jgi:hypothetical protein